MIRKKKAFWKKMQNIQITGENLENFESSIKGGGTKCPIKNLVRSILALR